MARKALPLRYYGDPILRKKAEAEQQRAEEQVRGDVIKSGSCAPEKNTCAREKTIGDAE